MARLIKIKDSDDWHGKIALGPYRQKRARYCQDKGTSATWHALLQAAVDRHGAGEPIKPETARELPHRLLEQFGLVSRLAAKRRGSYADNVRDYIDELKLGGCDARYVAHVNGYLTAVGDASKWQRLQDVSRDGLVKYLEQRKVDGAAPRTLKNIRATAVAFALWGLGAKRLDSNPLARLPRIDDTADRRRQRRALTPAEVGRLLAVAGPRQLVYRVALGTGLRLRELRRLQWRDVLIDDTIRPRLQLRPEATKSKRADTLPLSAALAARLRTARPAEWNPTDSVFRTVPAFDTWEADMKRASIEHRDGEVLTVGFHSLRVTFCSELERAGVSPRTIMELMRHRDYKLTAGTYTDPRVIDTFDAVGKLPEYVPQAGSQVQTALRTGTDNQPVRQDQIRDQTTFPSVQDSSHASASGSATDVAKTLENKAKTAIPRVVSQTPRVGLEPT